MSQLTNNTAALQEILATVNALPEAGGGSGGAEIETCTVTTTGVGISLPVSFTTYENGTFSPAPLPYVNGLYAGPVENVVCGSAMVVLIMSPWLLIADKAELISTQNGMQTYKITAAAGETVTLDAVYND